MFNGRALGKRQGDRQQYAPASLLEFGTYSPIMLGVYVVLQVVLHFIDNNQAVINFITHP